MDLYKIHVGACRRKLTLMTAKFTKVAAVVLLFFLFFLVDKDTFAQKATIIKFDGLQKVLDSQSDRIQVINFWATWCAPCIKELPLLEKLNTSNDFNAKITLINLDYADKIGKVNEFIGRKNIRSEVLLLDEVDYNSWIDKVDEEWSGAIPATLIFNPKSGKRKFIEGELKEGELENVISSLN
jgi:thiol-disulfide isomerase/thioredoxin